MRSLLARAGRRLSHCRPAPRRVLIVDVVRRSYGGTAGVAFDRCYHQLCDDMTNLNDKGLREHTDAAVHAILTFAQTTSAVNGTSKASGTSIKPWDWKGSHQVH
jgi:hypothetical protein